MVKGHEFRSLGKHFSSSPTHRAKSNTPGNGGKSSLWLINCWSNILFTFYLSCSTVRIMRAMAMSVAFSAVSLFHSTWKVINLWWINEWMPSFGDIYCNKGQVKDTYQWKVCESILPSFTVLTWQQGLEMKACMICECLATTLVQSGISLAFSHQRMLSWHFWSPLTY